MNYKISGFNRPLSPGMGVPTRCASRAFALHFFSVKSGQVFDFSHISRFNSVSKDSRDDKGRRSPLFEELRDLIEIAYPGHIREIIVPSVPGPVPQENGLQPVARQEVGDTAIIIHKLIYA